MLSIIIKWWKTATKTGVDIFRDCSKKIIKVEKQVYRAGTKP